MPGLRHSSATSLCPSAAGLRCACAPSSPPHSRATAPCHPCHCISNVGHPVSSPLRPHSAPSASNVGRPLPCSQGAVSQPQRSASSSCRSSLSLRRGRRAGGRHCHVGGQRMGVGTHAWRVAWAALDACELSTTLGSPGGWLFTKQGKVCVQPGRPCAAWPLIASARQAPRSSPGHCCCQAPVSAGLRHLLLQLCWGARLARMPRHFSAAQLFHFDVGLLVECGRVGACGGRPGAGAGVVS